jgi:penicillin-binding protein-related factor A (putative recombinase)
MRKGFSLEQRLDKLCEWINNHGGHAHKNHAQRTVDGVYKAGEPFDYEIFYHGKVRCFDAKECKAAAWSLSNAKLLQVKNLLQCADNGADAFFLVYFYPSEKLIKFDVRAVRNAMAAGEKSLRAERGEEWTEFSKKSNDTRA